MHHKKLPRICFVSARSAYFTGSRNIAMDWANGRLIQVLADRFDNSFSLAVFNSPARNKNYQMDITLNELYSLPFPLSFGGGIINTFKFVRILKEIQKHHDLLIVQLPFVGFLSLFFNKKPVVFHLCANVLTASANPLKYRGAKGIVSGAFARWMHACFQKLFRRHNSALIVNGDELGGLYAAYNPKVVVSSSVFKNEILSPDEIKARDPSLPFELLFIGRPSKEKGFPVLIDAFRQLIQDGMNVRLSMIGISRDELTNLADFNLEDVYLEKITFYGFVSWGEKFKEIVSSCHCLIMCSVSEGTPRVLIESRALGCPVIATRVGGVVSSVSDMEDGLLVPILNVNQIVAYVKELTRNEDLRLKLIRNGLKRIENCTLESFADTFVEQVNILSKRL